MSAPAGTLTPFTRRRAVRVLKQLFKLNAGYFQMQMASERDREAAYKLVGKHLREDANGLPQMAYVGVIVTQSPRPESAQEVCDQLVAAAKHIDKQCLGSRHSASI
jgi:hypothetical protein